ncbi:MAG: hypothetical protein IV100_33495 [Myxococcales bacterium]|nr:hypothetical protein [Myxococcales bacterium]
MAVPPLSAPITLSTAALDRCVRDLAVPTGWVNLHAEAVERGGHVIVALLLAGPLEVAPAIRFEIPVSVTLDANESALPEARDELARALDLCRRAATNPALATWAVGLTDCVARLDAIGDTGRLLCRGQRDGIAAEPLWI